MTQDLAKDLVVKWLASIHQLAPCDHRLSGESNEQFISGKQSTTLEETFKNTWLLEICWRLSICLFYNIYIYTYLYFTSIHPYMHTIPSHHITFHSTKPYIFPNFALQSWCQLQGRFLNPGKPWVRGWRPPKLRSPATQLVLLPRQPPGTSSCSWCPSCCSKLVHVFSKTTNSDLTISTKPTFDNQI